MIKINNYIADYEEYLVNLKTQEFLSDGINDEIVSQFSPLFMMETNKSYLLSLIKQQKRKFLRAMIKIVRDDDAFQTEIS